MADSHKKGPVPEQQQEHEGVEQRKVEKPEARRRGCAALHTFGSKKGWTAPESVVLRTGAALR